MFRTLDSQINVNPWINVPSEKAVKCKNVLCHFMRLASVVGAVIQAIGRPEFEDGLRTGVQLEVCNDLQSVRTNPVVNAKAHMRRSLTLGEVYPSGDC